MKSIYLFINDNDKTDLFKKAQENHLSVSTLVGIITNEYLIYTVYKNSCLEHYLNRGKNQVHLHIKDSPQNQAYKFTDKNYNNAIYMYLHHKELKNYILEENKTLANFVKTKELNTKIGRIIKETYDPNYLMNQMIRTNYMIKRIREQN